MLILPRLAAPHAWLYAVRTLACVVLLAVCRPWRWYAPPRVANLVPGFVVGVLIFGVWVGPEVRWSAALPAVQEFYLRFGVLPLGQLPEATRPFLYAPEVCGWPLSVVRLLGSTLVIATIEEFFWRGFLYRWIIDRSFLRVKLSEFDWEAFVLAGVFFGLEHNRWIAGMICGFAYAYLMVRTRDIWAVCFAHIVTNLLLGLYVLATGAYVFW